MSTETRVIVLPKGGKLEVEVGPGFYEALRVGLNVADDVTISDDHIRMFIHGTVSSAMEEHEHGV